MKVSRWNKKLNGMTVDSSLQEMQMYQSEKKKILACGHIYYSNRIKFLYDALKKIEDTELLILCENATTTYTRIERDNIPHLSNDEKDRIKFFLVPDLFIKDSFHEFKNVHVSIGKRFHIKKTPYLREAAANLRERHWNMGKGYPENFVYEAEGYINAMLDILKPELVIIWNQFHAFHHILGEICKKRKIEIVYYEFGVLPGTYALERLGQMGESYPAKCYEEFRNLPVTEEDLNEADKIWRYLKRSKLNRKEQSKNNELDLVKSKLKPNRPTIFYAGQNDFESGIRPYTKNTRKNHSPMFRSSDEGARQLAIICKKNDWNFVYKRHPLVSRFVLPEKLTKKMPDNVLMFDNLDISEIIELSDVTLTILSQVGYVSTILKKPTIMLGYMQLKGKGCTYEVFERKNIEDVIKKALQEGFTKEQKDSFKKHIAQLCKYYVFNDPHVEREMYYGRDMQQCTNFFLECINDSLVRKHSNKKVYTRKMILGKIFSSVKGRKVWRLIYDSQPITLGVDRIIIIPEEDRRTMYYAMLYMDKFLEYVHAVNAVIVTDSQLVCDTIGIFTQKFKSLTKISTNNMNDLLKYQIIFGDSEIATIASLSRYTGRLAEELIGKEGISTEELIAVGVYDLSYYYHEQKKRMENVSDVYLKLYFPEIDGGKMAQITRQKTDASHSIEFKEDMVQKRGNISLIISDNVAQISLYLNKIGKCRNEVGVVIPKECAPMKNIMTVASTTKGTNYMVTIKSNGEIWFNLADERQCPILVECTWAV